MLFTIIFLSWLFSLREKAEWNVVRNEVYFNIRLELASLFDEVIEYLKGGFDFKLTLWAEKDKEKNMSLISSGLNNLKNSKIDPESLAVSQFFKHRESLEPFLDVEKHLSDIQTKYSKHLPADITVSLIRIQQGIWGLEMVNTFSTKLQELSSRSPTPLSLFLPQISKGFESIHLEMLQGPLIALTKELNLLYSNVQLRFSYPP